MLPAIKFKYVPKKSKSNVIGTIKCMKCKKERRLRPCLCGGSIYKISYKSKKLTPHQREKLRTTRYGSFQDAEHHRQKLQDVLLDTFSMDLPPLTKTDEDADFDLIIPITSISSIDITLPPVVHVSPVHDIEHLISDATVHCMKFV